MSTNLNNIGTSAHSFSPTVYTISDVNSFSSSSLHLCQYQIVLQILIAIDTAMAQLSAQTAGGTTPSGAHFHPDTLSGDGSSESASTQAQASTKTPPSVPTIDYEELSRVMMPGLVQGVSNIFGEQIRAAIMGLKDDIKQLPTRNEMNDKVDKVEDKIDGLRDEMNKKIDGLRSEVRNEIQGLRNQVYKEIQVIRNEVREGTKGVGDEVNELRNQVFKEVHGLRNELREGIKGVGDGVNELRTELQNKIQDLHDEMHEQFADVQLSMHGLANANMNELHNTVGEVQDDIGELRTDMQDELGELRTDMHKTFEELRKDTIPVTQNLSNRVQDMNFGIDMTLRRHVDSINELQQVARKHSDLLTEVGLDVMKMGTSNTTQVETVRVKLQDGLNAMKMKMGALKDAIRNNMESVQSGLDAMYGSNPGPAIRK